MSPSARTEYWRKYVHKRKVDLLKKLSPEGVCHKCGEKFPHEDLTVDHLSAEGAGWDHNELNQRARVARYWREYEAGVPLGAACGTCNYTDGGHRRWR